MYFSVNRKRIVTLLFVAFLSIVFLMIPFRAYALTAAEAQIASTQGWHSLPDGKITYMVNASQPATGFVKIGSRWYHFDQEGYLSLGWFTENGEKYFAATGGRIGAKKGALKSGYAKADNSYYQFSTEDLAGKFGAQEVGWLKVNGKVFYYSETGTKLTGLQEVEGNLYFFATRGSAKNVGRVRTGWRTVSGKKYYFRATEELYGAAYRNVTVPIDGKQYAFAEDGSVITASSQSSDTTATAGSKNSSSGKNQRASLSQAQQSFIEQLGMLARADMKATGVLASVTVAQAIVESGFGGSSLAKEANNLFGMKATLSATSWASEWDGQSYDVDTQEYLNGAYKTMKQSFRKYPSYAASVADHSAYLTGAKLGNGSLRYDGLVGCKDYTKAITIIKNGGYATAPNYVSVIVNVIEQYGLDEFDH